MVPDEANIMVCTSIVCLVWLGGPPLQQRYNRNIRGPHFIIIPYSRHYRVEVHLQYTVPQIDLKMRLVFIPASIFCILLWMQVMVVQHGVVL